MSENESHEQPQKGLRLWPVVLLLITCVVLFTVPRQLLTRQLAHFISQFGSVILGPFLFLGWWIFASRAKGALRWIPAIAFFAPIPILWTLVYPKAPMNLLAWGPSSVALLWFAWLIVDRFRSALPHVAGVTAVVIGAWTMFSMVRIDETDADVMPELRWFWQPTKEQRFLEEKSHRSAVVPAVDVAITVTPSDWPEFRGVKRDGIVTGVSIETDWDKKAPKKLWKQLVGPGWGSFSVVGKRVFTQEQRGDKECVVSYDADTGSEIWEFAENTRFYEGIAGAGPRGTPTIHKDRVYAMGATGLLSCLDAGTGKRIWAKDIRVETEGNVPPWGYSSSPLIVNDLAIVYAGGPDKGTAAFKISDGSFAWASGTAGHTYSSAQLVKLGGVEQVLMVSDRGIESFQPTDGKRLWYFDWYNKGGNRVCQPAVIDDSSLLISTGAGNDLGMKRVKVIKSESGAWSTEVVWFSKKMKSYFNDGVIYQGHYYGFDDKSLACIDLADGKQKWSAGQGYGHGQLVLLADQGLLVVQAVDGKVALVKATPSEYLEESRFEAITGKTWNHPVVSKDRLYVRNGGEAACYQLPTK